MSIQPKTVTPQADEQSDFDRLLSKPIVQLGDDKPPVLSPPTATKPVMSHQDRFQMWRDRCAFWLREKHGRVSIMARHLGVSRQTVWRWFFNTWSSFPGWAAVASNIYYSQNVTPDLDKLLKQQQIAGTFQVPPSSRARRTPIVAGSADNDEEEAW